MFIEYILSVWPCGRRQWFNTDQTIRILTFAELIFFSWERDQKPKNSEISSDGAKCYGENGASDDPPGPG